MPRISKTGKAPLPARASEAVLPSPLVLA